MSAQVLNLDQQLKKVTDDLNTAETERVSVTDMGSLSHFSLIQNPVSIKRVYLPDTQE